MSEYQYYEFAAIDRPLDERKMDRLRALSSRAEITPTSFQVVYNYGDFRGRPLQLMHKYFDAFVYVANWGTRQLMLRLPRKSLDCKAAKKYAWEGGLQVVPHRDHVVLAFEFNEEAGDWVEGEGWLRRLVPLRNELLDGDPRGLYLGWLAQWPGGAADDDFLDDADADEREPELPPGLGQLTPALESLAEFLQIDCDLIAAAAAGDERTGPASPSNDGLLPWLDGVPVARKNAWLADLVADRGLYARAELLREFRAASAASRAAGPKTHRPRRRVVELRDSMHAIAGEREKREAAEQAAEKARLLRRKAKERTRHLDALAGREAELWREVELLMTGSVQKEYDRAVELLRDLRELAARDGRVEEAESRVVQFRVRFSRKSSLMRRFEKAGLGVPVG